MDTNTMTDSGRVSQTQSKNLVFPRLKIVADTNRY